MSNRHVAAALTTASLLTLGAGNAGARPEAPRPVAHRGGIARIVIHPPQLAACAAEIHYADGSLQQTGIASAAHGGRILWLVRVPQDAALGIAHWTARCGISWQRTGTWRITKR